MSAPGAGVRRRIVSLATLLRLPALAECGWPPSHRRQPRSCPVRWLRQHAGVRALLSWQRVRVSGYSMTPTLLPGDRLLVRHGRAVRPGGIALARFRGQPELLVVKRVAGAADGGWLLSSDNPRAGSDSRQYGAAEVLAVAVRLWPRGQGRPRAGWPARLFGRPIPPPPPDGL